MRPKYKRNPFREFPPVQAFLAKLLREEDGPTAVEYAVMLAMIVMACLVGIRSVGTQTSASFTDSAGKIDQALGQ